MAAEARNELMEQRTKESHWYLLTGLLLGLAIGLVIALLIAPVENVDALPSELSLQGKDDYRTMIALAYSGNQDLERALSRLELLEEQTTVDLMVAQAQNVLAEGGSESIARALAELATRLSQYLPTSP
jgi:gas vesicle protein